MTGYLAEGFIKQSAKYHHPGWKEEVKQEPAASFCLQRWNETEADQTRLNDQRSCCSQWTRRIQRCADTSQRSQRSWSQCFASQCFASQPVTVEPESSWVATEELWRNWALHDLSVGWIWWNIHSHWMLQTNNLPNWAWNAPVTVVHLPHARWNYSFLFIFSIFWLLCPVRQNQQHHSRETLRVKVRYTSSLMRDFIHITVLCMKRSDGLLLALFIHQASILKLQSETS